MSFRKWSLRRRKPAQSSRTNSYSSVTSSMHGGSFCSGEPITLFRLELERLQYILHFPEEVAFQLSMTEYQLFYGIAPIDFIRYVGCDLASIPIGDNPSPVRNLVKRLSEVSSWITHVIISQPTHEERKNCLAAIIRVIDTCWNIGNFNAAVEILMGLKSSKLRPFWLSLKHEERQRYEEFVDILLPNGDSSTPHPIYLETIQRALRMPQCRVIPFFGTFLRDLYAIVNQIPNVVVIGNSGEKDKLKFLSDINGDDHFSSHVGVGGLLNTDKINLVGIIIDNLEIFHNHHKQLMRYVELPALFVENTSLNEQPVGSLGAIQPPSQPANEQPQLLPPLEVKTYEPVQPVAGSSHGVTLIPLNSTNFDLDLIQRLQHGTTAIHYDLDSGRSVLVRLVLDASCSTISWHRSYYGGRDGREKESASTSKTTGAVANMSDIGKYTTQYASSSAQQPPSGSRPFALDEGFIRTTSIKSVESVDSYDLDIEAIYKRHSMEEMSVPVNCWTINFGCTLNENEFLYFLAPQQIAQYWTSSLQKIVRCLQNQARNPDRRVMWLKKLYLQLYNECACNEFKRDGPRPVEALQAFGGRVEKWKNFGGNQSMPSNPRPTESLSSTDGGGTKSRFKQMTIAVTRRVKGASRDCSRSQSPQPLSPLVRPPSIRSQLSSQSGPPGPNSPGFLLKPRGGGNAPPPPTIAAGGACTSVGVSGTTCVSVMGGDLTAAFSDAGDLDSLYTPRSRTPTSSSYGGRSVGGRSIKSWRSRGGETPNSGSISSSGQVSGLHGLSGKEYQEKPVSFTEFLELFRLFSTRMRKDLKDLFNDCIHSSSANSHVTKRPGDRDKTSPRLQSRLESLSGPSPTPSEFIPDDALTRNSSAHLCHLNDKQQKIYNALALASVNSAGFMDSSRNTALSVTAIKQFFCAHQMEQVDDAYVHRLIQEHEPDPLFRSKQLMSFEGFVRYLTDPTNFAFVPEDMEVTPDQLQYPLSYYYISCSHNTYLTGHQLKGESSAEMYRQVLQTGCRCVELDCWDGDDGLPLIYHGHTFTTKISFRQVVDVIKKSAFETSNLPLILSIENHCSLQQQTKMAQMFKTAFGEKLVTNFIFDCDYSDAPRLPTPWQLRNRILIKNKKMTVDPYPGIYHNEKTVNITDTHSNIYRKHSRSSYDSSTIDDGDDDLDEFLDEEEPETDDGDETGVSPTAKVAVGKRRSSARRRSSKDSISSFTSERTTPNTRRFRKSDEINAHAQLDRKSTGDDEAFSSGVAPPLGTVGSICNVNGAAVNVAVGGVVTQAAIGASTPRRAQAALSRLPTGHQIAAELSELIIYTQAVKFKGFVLNTDGANVIEMASSPLNAAASSGVGSDYGDHRSYSNSFTTPKMRSQAHSLLSSGAPPRRQKSSSQISTTDSMKSSENNNNQSALAGGTQLSPGAANFLPSSSGSTNSATHSVIAAAAAAVAASSTAATSSVGGSSMNASSNSPNAFAGRAPPPNASAACYQVSSITEASARKLCRKHPEKCIAYTQNQIMRTYPGGMRIDSSNFNPHRLVEFWECGLQMVALNYQTPDVAMHVNSAMFEQSGNCGYMLKPRALWDQMHPLYGRFNPMLKNQNDEGSALLLQLTVISGQYVCPGVFTASPFLEIEIIGVSADSAKHKSKTINRNSVNPQWNHTVEFRINFIGLAFLRIAVCDGNANGRVLSQRVVPVRCLRPGYRHLPLRSPADQPLEQATLFLRSRFEQEERIYLHDEDILQHNNNGVGPNLTYGGITVQRNDNQESELAYQILKIDQDANIRPLSILRKQIFVIRIVGLFPDETPTIVHAESGSTVRQVIQAALSNCGKVSENADDFALFEESVLCSTPSPMFDASGSGGLTSGSTINLSALQNSSPNDLHDTSSAIVTLDSPSTSTKLIGTNGTKVKGRELPHNEPIMDAVACWNGSTRRFYLRKKSADPSSRTWITSIMRSGGTNTMSAVGNTNIISGYPSGTTSLSGFTAQPLSFGVQGRRGMIPPICMHGGPTSNSSTNAVLESPRTPKSHSSTQLHGHSLDVEPTVGSSIYSDHLLPAGIHPRAKSMGETFLVCIHNVSDNHSYAILRTSIDNTATDIIKQIFAKTQRHDTNEADYAIVEELYDTVACVSEPTTTRHFGGKISVDSLATATSLTLQRKPVAIYRILDANENLWKAQMSWPTQGRFILERRDQLAKFEKMETKKQRLLNASSDSNQSLAVGGAYGGAGSSTSTSAPSQHNRETPRKISLSNMRSIGFTRRFSRFGKSMTLDVSRNARDN